MCFLQPPSKVAMESSDSIGAGFPRSIRTKFLTAEDLRLPTRTAGHVNAKGELVGIAKGGYIQRGVEAVRFGIKTSSAGMILEQTPTSANFDIQVSAWKRKRLPSQIFRELSPYVVMIEAR